MRFFYRFSVKKGRYRFLKVVVWVILIAIFPLSALGASPEPLIVVNPFVPVGTLCRMRDLEKVGRPLLVLNPYVEPLDSGLNSPYLRAVPSPQIVFPSK